jgi:hypothetical protein
MSRDITRAPRVPIFQPRPANIMILFIDLIRDIEVLEFIV